MLFSLLIFVLLGFGALAVDLSYLRFAQSQAQDIADASSQAAMIALRRTGNAIAAHRAATRITELNYVAGASPDLLQFEIGVWDDATFAPTTVHANAARVRVGRQVPTMLAPLFDWSSSRIAGEATSSAQTVQVILAVDIGNTWFQADFDGARHAALTLYDTVVGAHGPDDRLGMVVFNGRFGVEHTPLALVDEHLADGTRTVWENLRTASRAGTATATNPYGCVPHLINDFTSPPNGCFPQMWRQYTDETGTDHAMALEMALTMFAEQPDRSAYRALVILTDGAPTTFGAHQVRDTEGYDETRWRYLRSANNRDAAAVVADATGLASVLHDDHDVDIWAVSFVDDPSWLDAIVRGEGYAALALDSAALPQLVEDIAESLPLTIVQ